MSPAVRRAAALALAGALVAACSRGRRRTAEPAPAQADLAVDSAPAADSTRASCLLAPRDTLTAYLRPNDRAAEFGQLAPGDSVPVHGWTLDGWVGFEPGVAQAANMGPFRLRWVRVGGPYALVGDCEALPRVPSLPAGTCFTMAMDSVEVRVDPDSTAAVIAVLVPGDWAPLERRRARGAETWIQVDLTGGNRGRQAADWEPASLPGGESARLGADSTGWIRERDLNVNGTQCERFVPRP